MAAAAGQVAVAAVLHLFLIVNDNHLVVVNYS